MGHGPHWFCRFGAEERRDVIAMYKYKPQVFPLHVREALEAVLPPPPKSIPLDEYMEMQRG